MSRIHYDDDVSALTGGDSINKERLLSDNDIVLLNNNRTTVIQPSSLMEGNNNIDESMRFRFDSDLIPIYGRETELAQLEESFAKTKKSTLDRQLVLLEGNAGVGKSSLAYQLRRTVAKQGGFFLAGKFEQPSSGGSGCGGSPTNRNSNGNRHQAGEEPYAAVTMACRELCYSLLTHRQNSRSDDDGHSTTSQSSSTEPGMHSTNVHHKIINKNWNFTFEDVQTKLKTELEPNVVQVLTTVFPDLTQILESNFLDDDDKNYVGYDEAKQQFKYAIRRLLRVISSFGPMVLFLDDVQWADAASLDFLKNLMTDCKVVPSSPPPTNAEQHQQQRLPGAKATMDSIHRGDGDSKSRPSDNGIMVLAAYRTDDVPDNHPLRKTLREIKKEVMMNNDESDSADVYSVKISKVKLENLEIRQVNELLTDVLKGTTNDETLPLAECIHHKTNGNALYVVQFLETLSSGGHTETPLIRFSKETSNWEWDVEEIRVSQSATKNVVQMIQQKLKRQPVGFRRLLPVVALLGASFEYDILDCVVQHFNTLFQRKPDSAKEALSTNAFVVVAEKEGVLVVNRRKKAVRFGHDKIREAAINLVEKRELSTLGIQLGRLFMQSFTKEEQERNIFIIVSLLTVDPASPMSDENQIYLAELNLKAGTKSLRSTAVDSAVVYLGRSVALLKDDHWSTHYDLCLESYSIAAEAYFANGEFEKARGVCKEIHSQIGISPKDRQRADLVTINMLGGQGNTFLAQEECIRQLAERGCTFPRRGQALHIMGGILKVEMTVKSIEKQVRNLPIMTDPSMKFVMRLLDRLATYAYQNKSDLFVLVVLKSLQYTLKHGVCDYTPPVFCLVGVLLGGVLGDHNNNVKFGEMALAQYRKTPKLPKTANARTVFLANGFNVHLHHSSTDMRQSFFDGYKEGMAMGDIESACWMILSYLELCFHTGMPLHPLERDMYLYTKQMSSLNQEKIYIPK